MLNLLKNFERYLLKDRKSPKTIESYVGDTSVFVVFLESK